VSCCKVSTKNGSEESEASELPPGRPIQVFFEMHSADLYAANLIFILFFCFLMPLNMDSENAAIMNPVDS
jgi:hypothetical protein